MQQRPFGRSGPAVPIIGAGTWNTEGDRKAAIEALRAALDAGATHIDTAEMYGDGQAEELVAEAIEGRRAEVFLVSKVLPNHGSRRGVRLACESSLARLKTDHLDCYLLHWPGPHPLEETLGAFEELRGEGKILSYGVSNFDVELLEQAVRIAGPLRIACNQVLHHLGERYAEKRVLPACLHHGVALVGYSPFGSGSFPSATSAGGRVLAEIAQAKGATARQVALAFLVRVGGTFAIPKASDAKHAADNAAAGDLKLTDEEAARLDEAFPFNGADTLPTI